MEQAQLKNSAIIVSLLTLTSPLELIKIRLQTAHELLSSGRITETYRSVSHCISSISKLEGVRSLWKGNAIGIARFFPN
jgi:solute carrier family 25 (mitochondrial adenine nucleotide translocator), member 4/5/6/31